MLEERGMLIMLISVFLLCVCVCVSSVLFLCEFLVKFVNFIPVFFFVFFCALPDLFYCQGSYHIHVRCFYAVSSSLLSFCTQFLAPASHPDFLTLFDFPPDWSHLCSPLKITHSFSTA